MYSPSLRYRRQGAPSGVPYRGQKRLHTILGYSLDCSPALGPSVECSSMDPFPMGGEASLDGSSRIQTALRGDGVPLAGFLTIHPRDLLARFASQISVREIEFASFANEPFFILTGRAPTDIDLTADGRMASSEFSREKILGVVRDVGRTAMIRRKLQRPAW